MNIDAIPVGPNPPWDLNVIIEIPANDFVKVFASYVINTFHSYCICPFNVT